MRYLIDGYNLLFRQLRNFDSLQKQRTELITNVAARVEKLGLDAAIVFDSHYQPSESSKHHLGALEIIYTAPGETADEFILKLLKDLKDPSHTTVVTSDKILANLCRTRLAKTMSVDEFISWIQKKRKAAPEPQIPILKSVLRPLVAPPAPPPKETEEKPTERTLEEYEQIFSESLKEAEHLQFTKRVERKAAKGKKKPPQKKEPVDSFESDLARWLEIFEKKSNP